jgi:hypothetical protein
MRPRWIRITLATLALLVAFSGVTQVTAGDYPRQPGLALDQQPTWGDVLGWSPLGEPFDAGPFQQKLAVFDEPRLGIRGIIEPWPDRRFLRTFEEEARLISGGGSRVYAAFPVRNRDGADWVCLNRAGTPHTGCGPLPVGVQDLVAWVVAPVGDGDYEVAALSANFTDVLRISDGPRLRPVHQNLSVIRIRTDAPEDIRVVHAR